jgi:ABC-type glutathione transport system ATPase component
VASGGEMSRIMLVKAILAQYSKLPTLIFDEIDTGVSGEIAIKMGEIMKEVKLCKYLPLPIYRKLQLKVMHILKFLN